MNNVTYSSQMSKLFKYLCLFIIVRFKNIIFVQFDHLYEHLYS